MIRVLVISGICLYREGLAEMLDRTGEISVVASASDVTEGLTMWNELEEPPNVILLDTAPTDADASIRALLEALPDVRVVALAVPNHESEILAVAEAGIAGFVTSDASVAELVAAIESVARGETLCTPSVVAALMRRLAALARSWADADPVQPLTRREREILELIDEGSPTSRSRSASASSCPPSRTTCTTSSASSASTGGPRRPRWHALDAFGTSPRN